MENIVTYSIPSLVSNKAVDALKVALDKIYEVTYQIVSAGTMKRDLIIVLNPMATQDDILSLGALIGQVLANNNQ